MLVHANQYINKLKINTAKSNWKCMLACNELDMQTCTHQTVQISIPSISDA